MKKLFLGSLCLVFCLQYNLAQEIPSIYSHIHFDDQDKIYLKYQGEKIYGSTDSTAYTLSQMQATAVGSDSGLRLKFDRPSFNGTLYFGFINYNDGQYPLPVYFKKTVQIVNGEAFINIKKYLSGKYDMIDWEQSKTGTLGYRVASSTGQLLYDGKMSFEVGAVFHPLPTLIEGPFVNLLTDSSCVISFKTDTSIKANIRIANQEFTDSIDTKNHEIKLSGLTSDQHYFYRVEYGKLSQEYSLHTAPLKGSQKAFTFGYISDSRGGQGGGERNYCGSNAYIIKKAMALAAHEKVAFVQFTGDMITGYGQIQSAMDLQYANWKNAISPFAARFPVNVGMGNHESYNYQFILNPSTDDRIRIDHFPFASQSGESLFARHFVNPHNGPVSEDGADYDPNPDQQDFPPYDETVFAYTYANCAFIILNSNYLYAPELFKHPETGGNIHAYIMDNQLEWLKGQIQRFESDEAIDHIFVSIHTPAFPNGGHSHNDMWYTGDNDKRPVIAGKAVDIGIIERRDQFLNILINQSKKVAALLTGDEHNYNYLPISDDMPRYPESWSGSKLKLSRNLLQINDGSAGAPYYAQEKLPWSAYTKNFSTQHALVLITVNGKSIKAVVRNPDTLETIDIISIR